MPLSGVPGNGPTLPSGATKVAIKNIDTAATASKEDVTVLADSERMYADPPLKPGSSEATITCSASGFLEANASIAPTDVATKTGWILEDCEIVYEVGKYVTWSGNWSYYAP